MSEAEFWGVQPWPHLQEIADLKAAGSPAAMARYDERVAEHQDLIDSAQQHLAQKKTDDEDLKAVHDGELYGFTDEELADTEPHDRYIHAHALIDERAAIETQGTDGGLAAQAKKRRSHIALEKRVHTAELEYRKAEHKKL